MLLSEALRASKTRCATGYLAIEGCALPIATASDTVVVYTLPILHETGDISLSGSERRAWGDLPPGALELIDSLRWEPDDPKSALTQLAEAVDDWQEENS